MENRKKKNGKKTEKVVKNAHKLEKKGQKRSKTVHNCQYGKNGQKRSEAVNKSFKMFKSVNTVKNQSNPVKNRPKLYFLYSKYFLHFL